MSGGWKIMLKLVYFVHGFNMGGAEVLVREYALNVDKNKYDLTVLCTNKLNTPNELLLEYHGVDVIYVSDYLPLKNSKSLLSKTIRMFSKYYWVRKILRGLKPDIIHSHQMHSSYLRFARLKKSIHIFYTIHTDVRRLFKPYDGDSLRSVISKRRDFKDTKYLIRNNGMRLIALHDNMRIETNMLFNIDNCVVVNNGIDIKKYKGHQFSRTSVKKNLGIPLNSFVVGHIGRFHDVKNHVFLVEVFKEIYNRNKNAFLLLIGDGEKKAMIETQLSMLGLDNRFLILSNRMDMPNLLSAMDVFVFPSKIEGMPISLIEAQSSRIPCFVSENVTKEVATSNIINFLDINKSPSFWAEKILSYEFPSEIVVDDYNWDINKILNDLDNVYLDSMD